MIDAVIFDLDGLLIDSEPCWVQAEMEIFGDLGIELTPELCAQTTGLRLDAMVCHWYDRNPRQTVPPGQIATKIAHRVAELCRGSDARPGVPRIFNLAQERGPKLAVCSSSPYLVIDEAMRRLKLANAVSVVHSAEDEAYGKPHPAAYMTTARKLETAGARCLAFEDSINGAISAKAAGMKVVAVPSPAGFVTTGFDFCDAKIASLAEFGSGDFERFVAS